MCVRRAVDFRLTKQQQGSTLPNRHLRLPVLLGGVHVQNGHLQVQVFHYPLLLRWTDWYRGRPADRFFTAQQHNSGQVALSSSSSSSSSDGHRGGTTPDAGVQGAEDVKAVDTTASSSSSSGTSGLLTCTIAGLQGVDASVAPLLLQHLGPCTWHSGSSLHTPRVLQLRAFALTAVDQPTAAAGAGAAAAPSPPEAAPEAAPTQNRPVAAVEESVVDGSNGSSAGSTAAGSSTGSDRWFQQQPPDDEGWGREGQLACEMQQVWAELWVKGLPPSSVTAAAEQVARSPPLQAAAGAAPSRSTGSSPTQHGSSGASSRQVGTDTGKGSADAVAGAADGSANASQRVLSPGSPWGGWGLLTAVRQRDVAELLLHHGLARLAEPEDCEWLGVRQSRWRAYQRAEERAIRAGVGLHAHASSSSSAGLLRRLWAGMCRRLRL